MSLKQYGVLKGTVIGHLRDADDDHYQILVQGGDVLHRIAVNVKSAAKNAPSTVLFRALTSVPTAMSKALEALKPGYKALPSKAGGLAIDYVRSNLFNTSTMKPVPPDAAGVDNDLKDKLEDGVVRAMEEEGSMIHAFGEKWGPETTKADQYFGFKPGNGIHDIHMNQGNADNWKKDNGVYQDGGIVFQYPDGWKAFFFAFQSQTFKTDARGNALGKPHSLSPAADKKPKKTSGGTGRSAKKSKKKAAKGKHGTGR